MNPFRQPVQLYQLRFTVAFALVDAIESAFSDVALSTASFEDNDGTNWEPDGSDWVVDVFCEQVPGDIPTRLALLSHLYAVVIAPPVITEVVQQNWMEQIQKDFPALPIGRFYIHGSHITTPLPLGLHALKIDAGMAFGSGEHATTSGCLMALSLLKKSHPHVGVHALDMGTGSGILAMAIAKSWKYPVLAVDIDPVSVQVTRENVLKNRLQHLVKTDISDGYHSRIIKRHGPYSLIVSNILARPLCAFAKHAKAQLASGGILILSGLLSSQAPMVLAAHRMQKLRLIKRIRIGGWDTLVLS